MSTSHKTHHDITLYGVVSARRGFTPISTLWRLSRRNRVLCESHGHSWRLIRSAVIAELRGVDAARKAVKV